MGEILHTLILQPLFNLLVGIYSLLPNHDFGVAIIVMTVIIRLLLWPLLRKQIHQQKAMKELQPEIKKIKKKSKGDKQKESQMLMELYKEREVKPLASIGTLLVQLPILITLFVMLRNLLGAEGEDIVTEFMRNSYSFILERPFIQSIVEDPSQFTTTLFGVVDLHQSSVVLAISAGAAQFFQSAQLRSDPDDAKGLRDILNDAKEGKEVKMSDQNAAVMRSSSKFFPIITGVIALSLPAALALYWTVSNGLAGLQYKLALREEAEDMDESVDDDIDEQAKKSKSRELRVESRKSGNKKQATKSAKPNSSKSKKSSAKPSKSNKANSKKG